MNWLSKTHFESFFTFTCSRNPRPWMRSTPRFSFFATNLWALFLSCSHPTLLCRFSRAVLFLLFLLIYSLLCCPYTPMIRLSLHFVELIFLIQLVVMFLATSIEYGTVYSLDISSGDGSLYRFAWTLLSILNYLQILIFAILAFLILFDLSRAKICRKNQAKSQESLKHCLPSSEHPQKKIE